MLNHDLTSYLTNLREKLDAMLQELLPPREQSDPLELRRAMRKSVLGGGKRLRPCLTSLL